MRTGRGICLNHLDRFVPPTPGQVWGELHVYLAGTIAEAILGGRQERDRIVELQDEVEQRTEDVRHFGPDLVREEHDNSDVAKIAVLLEDSDEHIGKLIDEAATSTFQLLRKNWDRVTEIADVLVRDGRWVPATQDACG